MDFDDRAVETDRFELDMNQLLGLQFLKKAVEHAGFGPAIHPGVDRMPIPEALRQRAPLAAILGHVEDRVDHGEILVRDIAALARQKRFNASELCSGDFHAASISNSVNRP